MANSEGENPQKRKRENLAIFISILALVVSGISLWDSHRISGLQIAQAGPDLNVKHSELRRYDPAKPHDLALWMDVKNEGHLYVKVKEITVVPVFSLLARDESRKSLHR